MTWSFRNRIVLADKRLQSDEPVCTLYESAGETVTLFALKRTGAGFSTADWLLLKGEGYESSDQAFEAGRLWRQYLSVAFANCDIAADFDLRPPPSREPGDRPEAPEAPGLIVYQQPKGLQGRIEMYAPLVLFQPTLEKFLSEDLPAARGAIPNGLDRRLELAYTTFHMALATNNPEIKYILFVTAVEALIPDAKPLREDEVVRLLDFLRGQAKTAEGFSRKVRKRVAGILKVDREETITEVGKTLAAKLGDQRYDDRPPQEFFEVNYRGRSALVHGSTDPEKRPEPMEVRRRNPYLQQFVLDLLAVESAIPETQEG